MDWVKKHVPFLLEAVGLIGLVVYFVAVPTSQRLLLLACILILGVGRWWGMIVRDVKTTKEEAASRPAGTVVK